MSKTIIVTGASKGIGRAIVTYLAAASERHKLVLVARSKSALEELQSQSPQQIEIVVGDLSDFSLGQKAVDVALAKFGKLDGLIVNHGILGEVKRIADCDPVAWRDTFDVNFFSAVACVKAALPALRKAKGRIIFTSSGAAMNAYSTWGAYGASKAAINHLAMTLKNEEPDVTTIAVRPGVVDSDMQKEIREVHHATMDEKDRKKFLSAKEDGKLLRPELPGHVIARLAVGGSNDLSGRFVDWSDETLKEFQD